MALQFKLPQMSLTMQEGTIIRWVAEEGARLKRNDVLLEIETDKTSAELSSPCDGILQKRMFPAQAVVGVGEVICVIDDGSAEGAAPAANPAASAPSAGAENTAAPVGRHGKLASPLAARIAEREGVSLSGVTGTGPRGVIVKKDVLAAIEAKQQTPAAEAPAFFETSAYGPFTDEPFVSARKRTAENMMRSRMHTAALTTFVEADMTNIKRMREFVKATYTTYVVKAAANALHEFPGMNASLVGDSIRVYADANVNVAVSAGEKLVTPVIRRADKKNLLEVNAELGALAEKAREGKLLPKEFDGGTFTVTNSGVFGSLFFTPIINYPQCAILGIGKTVETPVVRDGQIVIAPVMKLCLTYDHQLVDGSTAVQFLQKVKNLIENPADLML